MKQFLIVGWLSLMSALVAPAATNTNAVCSLFINNNAINSPPDNAPVINACAWLNAAPFTNFNVSGTSIPLPFESQNTRFFTNDSYMVGNPGWRFGYNYLGQRLMMDTWTNSGTIISDSGVGLLSTLGTVVVPGNSQASMLIVRATNIASTGPLRSGAQGIIYLEGTNINLKRNGLRTGIAAQPDVLLISGTFLGSSNYVDDYGITDIWWGAGTNNYLNNKGPRMQIDNLGGFPQFSLPAPFSPQHQVVEDFGTGLFSTNLVLLPQFNFNNFTAAVWTSQPTPSNTIVQVVFYPTNNTDTNFSIGVQFMEDIFNGSDATIPVVSFNSTDFDIVDEAVTTTSVYLYDALATVTNVFLARNAVGNTRRPDTIEISHSPPFGFSSAPNAVFDPALIWNPSYRFNTVTNLYTAYQAQIASVVTAAGASGDPTNFPGRVQVIGQVVNLEQTRIRAESAFTLKVMKNLTSNRVAKIDAPFLNFDVASTERVLVISNIAPASVRRFTGNIACWSGTWKNFQTNTSPANEIFTHVLIVDPFIQAVQPVVVNEFAAHATNILIYDTLNINKSFVADGQTLDIKAGLNLPYGSGWAATNVLKLVNFTNEGTINVPQIANAGRDRPNNPYWNYINRGTNTAATHFISTTNFDNSGSLIASGGQLQLDCLTASMMGTPLVYFTDITTNIGFIITNFILLEVTNVSTNLFTNDFGARIQGNADVQLFARDMIVSNSFFGAQGRLIFSVTNRLTDSGTDGTNNWLTSSGFEMRTRPATSDLMGTYLRSTASRSFQESFHTWSAENRGAVINGYSNNLALGKLTLDGAVNSLFHFAPPTGQTNRALYVDYLELLDFATNYASAFDISPDMTIYFANANVNPSKLDRSNSGRLRWVTNFTGPLSSTNITYPSGHTYTFNIALTQLKTLDSDGDGIVNLDDPTPFYEPETVGLVAALINAPSPAAEFSWFTLAGSTNRIEYVSSFGATNWQLLTNIINGPTNGILRARDAVPAPGTRFYRIRVDLP